MPGPEYSAFVFDMDGTFMDTRVDYQALNRIVFDVMTDLGVPEEVMGKNEGNTFNLGTSTEWMVSHGLEKELHMIPDLVDKKATGIEMEHADESQPFPGAVELMDVLKKNGIRTGILTRGGRSYAEYILERHDLLNRFDVIIARGDISEEDMKPSPTAMRIVAETLGVKTTDILYFGDHKMDWMCARDSGAGFYGVTSGNYTESDWEALGVPYMNTVGDAIALFK